ncbi:MAG: DsbA family protein [Elstera sp.]
MIRFRRAVGAIMLGGLLLAGSAGAAEPFTDAQKDAVKSLVRDVLRDNPELVYEALQALEAKQQAEQTERSQKMIAASRAALERDPADPVLGNPQGDVTIVEFFDYRCPYCKQVTEMLLGVVKADGKLRLVLKEYPILGPQSVQAALAALAAQRQGKYAEMHMALMAHRGALDDKALEKIAGDVKLDMVRWKADLDAPELKKRLQTVLLQGREIGASGTPAFIIGDRLIPGAVDAETLKAAIAAARAKKS